jgi:aquaporin related protein
MNNVTPAPLVPTFTIPRSANADRPQPRRLPGLSWLDDGPRGHLVALLGEFAGTFLFLFFAFTGTQVANMSSEASKATSPEPGVLLYIALAFGFSLAVNAWVFFRISGGLFNPAVSNPKYAVMKAV